MTPNIKYVLTVAFSTCIPKLIKYNNNSIFWPAFWHIHTLSSGNISPRNSIRRLQTVRPEQNAQVVNDIVEVTPNASVR